MIIFDVFFVVNVVVIGTTFATIRYSLDYLLVIRGLFFWDSLDRMLLFSTKLVVPHFV